MSESTTANFPERAVVQSSRAGEPGCEQNYPSGTVEWAEHVRAWEGYHRQYPNHQSALRIHERSGFSYSELVSFLGHKPTTWKSR